MDLGRLEIKKDCFSPGSGSLHLLPLKCSDLSVMKKKDSLAVCARAKRLSRTFQPSECWCIVLSALFYVICFIPMEFVQSYVYLMLPSVGL